MKQRLSRQIGLVTIVALLATGLPWLGNEYYTGFGFTLLTWIALTESWIIISGMTGYVSLGHVVFVGLGAYVAALTWMYLPLWAILPLTGLSAAVLAALVGYPCLRVRGPYFVILTFGVSELVKFIVINIEVRSVHIGARLVRRTRHRRTFLHQSRPWLGQPGYGIPRARFPVWLWPSRHSRE